PQGGGSYPIELSGSGSFISAHGDILTADHVVNPPHDQSINDALYQIAAPDIADYINAHLHPNQPFASGDVVAELEAGIFPSTPVYDQPTSEVYLSTAYAGSIDATKFSNIPANLHASVDRIEAQSSFEAMDVAIVHVDGMDDMPSIQLDDSEQVAEQDNLTVIGFPGLADESVSPTNLLTSSINKVYVSAIKTTDANVPVIQVGGNIEHGDSGGPVLDSNGHIVGIVSFGLFDPNETGSTSFLQASNSARTLIQSLSLDITPGPFQKEWMQAFNDYSSPTPGHWHKASQELQNLVNGHPGFLGVTSYLVYAQNQAGTEQLPTPATGPNPVLIIVLSLLGVLVVLAIIYFVVITRRAQAVPAVPAPGWGMYAQPQSGMPGGYIPPTSSYSSDSYQPVAGATPASVPGATSGTYPPVPASSSGAAWYAQTTSAIPQTPQPPLGATPVLVAAVIPANGATQTALTPFPAQDDVAPQTALPPMPTWAPLPQTPQPVVQPIEPPVQVVAPLVENPAQPLAQDETVVIVPTDTPAPEVSQPTEVSAQETRQVMEASSLETPQPDLAISFSA
ncbi:MAG: trypsin-like peptidase domain-containing protein, partial [Ktedonobacteraceae bacterium]